MCTFTALGFLAVNPILYSCILMHKIKAYQIVNTRESKSITTMEACENVGRDKFLFSVARQITG